MKAVFEDARYFREILKALSEWIDEATFKMGPEGLFLKQMDPSRVILVKLELPKQCFYEFEAYTEKAFTVNVEYLVKNIFKNVYKDDKVVLEPDVKLLVKFTSDLDRKFSAPLLESPKPEDLEIPEPKIAFNCMAKVTVEGLKKILDDVEAIHADHLRIAADTDNLHFSASTDVDEYSVSLGKYSNHLLSLEMKEGFAKACYSFSWLQSFIKGLKPLADVLSIQYSSDMPMQIQAELRYGGTLTLWVAPRIEVEEEPLEEKQPEKAEVVAEQETETMENIPEQQEATETEPGPEPETVENPIPQVTVANMEQPERRVFYTKVAFLTDAPQIVGEDMQTYGPFQAGKVYDIPLRNASILIDQGLAVGWYTWNLALSKFRERHPEREREPSLEELKPYMV